MKVDLEVVGLKLELKVELEVVELELKVQLEVLEGWMSHIGRAGRIDSSQQQAIPNFIF